ncbi:MAG: GTPase Era [Acidobacteria bacterium]|nr:GTPase Era [Acidobacteriota bacterium]
MSKFKSGYVSIIGRPNMGKSTLLNNIIGEKVAIVSDKPQTTRNRIQAVKNYPDAQVIFLDTPGIHKPQHRMNQYMLKTALGTLSGIDIILVMMDVTQEPGKGDQFVIDVLPKGHEKKFCLINKVDLVKKHKVLAAIAHYNEMFEFDEIIPISALKGDNVQKVEQLILENLPEGAKYFEGSETTEYSDNFLVSEIIRERILHHTKEELPYSVAVMIESWEEGKKTDHINAVIYVSKPNHKKMVIGKGGEKLKKVGTEARAEIERIYGVNVYLELWVKVKEKWRDDERLLKEMGFSED